MNSYNQTNLGKSDHDGLLDLSPSGHEPTFTPTIPRRTCGHVHLGDPSFVVARCLLRCQKRVEEELHDLRERIGMQGIVFDGNLPLDSLNAHADASSMLMQEYLRLSQDLNAVAQDLLSLNRYPPVIQCEVSDSEISP